MNVWIMNLKDNREEKPADLSQSKFEFCKEKGIVGIGWAKPEIENAGDVAFSQAENAIDSFEIGDLVWVKNPSAENDAEKHYVCKITEKAVKTDDDTMNKYDIGKYCACEYIPVQSLPEELESERLIAVHTIEKANETITEKTQTLIYPVSGKKRKSKAKIGIIAGICALVLVLGVIFVPKAIGFVNMKTHPILPDGLEFGMTFDEVRKTTNYLDHIDSWSESKVDTAFKQLYDPFTKTYQLSVSKVFPYETLPLELGSCYLKFNEDKQLCLVCFYTDSDETESYDILSEYFKKAFNSTPTVSAYGTSEEMSGFLGDDITVVISANSHLVYIGSDKYIPQIPEISKQSITDALNSLNYNVSGFSMNLVSLINKCVSNREITYWSAEEAQSDKIINKSEVNKLIYGDFSEYAATSYVVVIHGDVCQNPDLPYYKTEDVDVVKILLIFDDYGKLISSETLEECDELQTFAVLTMFG